MMDSINNEAPVHLNDLPAVKALYGHQCLTCLEGEWGTSYNNQGHAILSTTIDH